MARPVRSRLLGLVAGRLRRTTVLRFADISLNRSTREVSRGSRVIALSAREFSLLEMLMAHPRIVLTRRQIYEAVWGRGLGPGSNALGVYVGYLRRKLEADGEPRLIQTIYGIGYVLREPF